MDASTVPLICYYGGILSSTNSADYIGGRSTASFISKLTTISDLQSQAKETCGLSEDTLVKLKCRYPLNQSMAIALDICDESSLVVAMAGIPTLSSSLVVYVEEVSQQSLATLGPSTVEAVDKLFTVGSPSESPAPRTQLKMGRGKDIGWLHCKPVGEGTNRTQCNYCGKVMSSGGITRMKQHLAGGNGVEKCTKCGLEVRQMFRELLRTKQFRSGKRLKGQRYTDLDCFEQEATEMAKEVSPVVHSLLVDDDSDDYTIEGVDKHAAIMPPSESRVPRTSTKTVRGRDIGWQHCKPVGDSTNKTKCNYCGKVMSGGGITRMKQHLAGGNDVEKCTMCGLEVRQLFRDLIRKKKLSKSAKRMKEQRYEEDTEFPYSFEQEAAKEVSPVVLRQLSAGASSSRPHEEIALLNKESDDEQV